jgi:hypothetical protein
MMRVSNPFSMSPSASSQAIQTKPNRQNNLERNGQLTLIGSIKGSELYSFLKGIHNNSEIIEEGFSQLGQDLLNFLQAHTRNQEFGIFDTITNENLNITPHETSSESLEEWERLFDQNATEETPPSFSIGQEFRFLKKSRYCMEEAEAKKMEEPLSKRLRIVSVEEDFYDDKFNFNLHLPIKDVDASLVMNADMLDEKDNPNLPLEIKVFEMVLTHLFQNKLLNQEQLKRMFAYETEDKADQGIGFIPMVTQKGDNVRLIRRFDRSLSVDA